MEYLDYFKKYTLQNEKNPELYEEKVRASYTCANRNVRVVFFDLETSPSCESRHPNANMDTIIEMGAVSDGDTFSSLCHPGHPILSTQFNGITDQDVVHAPRTLDVVRDFMTWVSPKSPYEVTLLIAHNAAQFDVKVLRAHIAKLGREYPDIIVGDSLYPSKISGAPSGKLEDIYRHLFQDDYVEKHRALDDARDLERVMRHLEHQTNTPLIRMLSHYMYPLMTSTNKKQYFDVPYDDKDVAKKAGAKWDPVKKRWFAQTTAVYDAMKHRFKHVIL